MTFYGMLGFPFLLFYQGLFRTTFGQSGGFQHKIIPFIGLFGVFPGKQILWFFHITISPQIQHFMSSSPRLYHYSASLGFYHIREISALNFGLYAFDTLSRLGRL
jgi:hypothetical protein